LADIVIALADLVEAEGRALRRSVVRTSLGIAFLRAATLMLVLGLGLCLWGIYQWLSSAMGPAGAASFIGALALLFSGGLVWLAMRLGR